jgi:hypothetical protein
VASAFADYRDAVQEGLDVGMILGLRSEQGLDEEMERHNGHREWVMDPSFLNVTFDLPIGTYRGDLVLTVADPALAEWRRPDGGGDGSNCCVVASAELDLVCTDVPLDAEGADRAEVRTIDGGFVGASARKADSEVVSLGAVRRTGRPVSELQWSQDGVFAVLLYPRLTLPAI